MNNDIVLYSLSKKYRKIYKIRKIKFNRLMY